MPSDKITIEQRASIIQNGLTRAECRLFFQLFDDAVRWRHAIEYMQHREPTEHEHALVAAVDAMRDHFGGLNARGDG